MSNFENLTYRLKDLSALLDELDGTIPAPDDLPGQVKLFAKARLAAQTAKDISTEINKFHDRMRFSVIPEVMQDEGVDMLDVKGVGKVSLQDDLRASLNKEREDGAFQWLDDTGHGDLIKQTVNANSLKALLRQMLRDGEEIPEEYFKITPFTMAKFRSV